jgi:predicted nucleic acid-binding protein
MKGLDTPVLLSILHDSTPAKELLKSLRGEELATTELNMFELETLATRGPPGRHAGLASALARLRRRITVLPVTAEAVTLAGRLQRKRGRPSNSLPLVWGVLSAAGCHEWVTTRTYAPPKKIVPFKIRIV